MREITYSNGEDVDAGELLRFYGQVDHDLNATEEQMRRMLECQTVFVGARAGGQLIGVARGFCDGVRGFFLECKLLPEHQGPGAVTRKSGRIEHDSDGIATEMARYVLDALRDQGAQRVDVVAWGTETDFLEELGFRRRGGLVGMTMNVDAAACPVRPHAATTAQR